MHFQENKVSAFDLAVTQDAAQYPIHHVTYVLVPVKFEVASSNSLGGDAFTRKYII